MALDKGYTLRDIDFIVKQYFKSWGLVLQLEGKNIRVPVQLSSEDPEFYKKTVPCIFIESGWDMDKDPNWQPAKTESWNVNALDATKADLVKKELIDFHYSYKVSFYIPFKALATAVDEMIMRKIPTHHFSLRGKSEGGQEYIFPVGWDGTIYVPDRTKNYDSTNTGLPSAETAGVDRVFKRELILTAQLLLEEISTKTATRPYAGVLTEMEILE